MTTIHVPPRLEADTIVYSTRYGGPETGCPVCGDPVELVVDERLYCCPSHKKRAGRIRNGHEPGELPVDPPAGSCRLCGGEVEQPKPWPGRTCGRAACKETVRTRGFKRFRNLVKRPHPLPWLGRKLNLAPDDPRLPELAVRLAMKGKLGVYVRADGTVGEVGRPKASNDRRRGADTASAAASAERSE